MPAELIASSLECFRLLLVAVCFTVVSMIGTPCMPRRWRLAFAVIAYDPRACWGACRAARLFTKPRFFEPLSQNTDPLAGLHANTHLAQVGAGSILKKP